MNGLSQQSLTLGDVLEKINGGNRSGLVLVEKNFTQMLSGVTRDKGDGRIVGAKGGPLDFGKKCKPIDC